MAPLVHFNATSHLSSTSRRPKRCRADEEYSSSQRIMCNDASTLSKSPEPIQVSRQGFGMRRSFSVYKGLDLFCELIGELSLTNLSETLEREPGCSDCSVMTSTKIGVLRDGEWVALA